MKWLVITIGVLVLSVGTLFAGGQSDTQERGAVGSGGPREWIGETGQDGFPIVNPLKVRGNIITAGSSTVFPLSEAIALKFKDEGYKGNITIDSIGTGAGFERFATVGETDIANASTPIGERNRIAARRIGRDPILEFRVGVDAIAITVSKNNYFLTNVTMRELAAIFSTAERWSDVNPAWPAQPIRRFIPGTDSGTFEFFVDRVFRRMKAPILSAKQLQLSEDDHVLIQGIAGSTYGIGFVGFAYFLANTDKVKYVTIEGITPDEESVGTVRYPLTRPLFLYTTAKIMNDKPQVAAFIGYYLANVNSVIREVGYFPVPESVLDASKRTWLEAMKGRL